MHPKCYFTYVSYFYGSLYRLILIKRITLMHMPTIQAFMTRLAIQTYLLIKLSCVYFKIIHKYHFSPFSFILTEVKCESRSYKYLSFNCVIILKCFKAFHYLLLFYICCLNF